tara:strand:+ start:60 stop:470 length:411 start_codon:yes stop_codon:yes gene_type:complete
MLTDILAWLAIIGMFLYVWFVSGAFGEAVGLALSPRKHNEPRRKFPDRTPKKDPVKPAEKRPKHLVPLHEALSIVGMKLEELKVYISTGDIQTYLEGGEMYVSRKDLAKLDKKTSYPIVTSYNEEHRITNPVEFNT